MPHTTVPKRSSRPKGEQRRKALRSVSKPVMEQLSDVGRQALTDLRDCAKALYADTRASANARVRIEVRLTTAARQTVEACRTLSTTELQLLVEHARAAGLIQKRSTPVAYALMRIACGTALGAPTVSRAARLIQHIVDTKAELDKVLPPGALFWREFEKHCGKAAANAARGRVALLLSSDILSRLQADAPCLLEVRWDAKRRVAVGRPYQAEMFMDESDAGSDPQRLRQETPQRLIAYQPGSIDPAPVTATAREVIGSTEWKAAGTNSEEEQAPLDVAATSGEELLPASATSGGSTSTAEDQDNAAPTSASEPGDQTNFLPQPQLGQVADRERERKVHLWFPRNVGQRSLEDLKRLRSGKWISISVAGADRRVWHGSLTPAVQDVMRRHDGEMVTLDREAPS